MAWLVFADSNGTELGNYLVANKTDVYLNVAIEFDDTSVTALSSTASFAVKKNGTQIAHYTNGALDTSTGE